MLARLIIAHEMAFLLTSLTLFDHVSYTACKSRDGIGPSLSTDHPDQYIGRINSRRDSQLLNVEYVLSSVSNFYRKSKVFPRDVAAKNHKIFAPQDVKKPSLGTVFPVTFQSSSSYVVARWKIYSTFHIYVQIRTLQPNSILLFSSAGVLGKDYMALELIDGQIRYSFDTGNGPSSIQSTQRTPINDNRWHEVEILRRNLSTHALIVDRRPSYHSLPDGEELERSVYLDLNDDVYVGGLPERLFRALPKAVRSKHGFHGCLASVKFNDKLIHLVDDKTVDVPAESRNLIKQKCEEPRSDCQRNLCHNGGKCIQEWNSYSCDCAMTSFTGSSCDDESIAYTFGHSGGLITFRFPEGEWPDTRNDEIAFGFLTNQRSAVLARIDSGNANDFIEIELVDGNVFVAYNMGLTKHVIGDVFEKVNDNKYHVVRFSRAGANSTIQIDNFPVQPKNVTGPQLTTFNHQAVISVGGRRYLRDLPIRHFRGTIAGLSINGLNVLDLSADGDTRVTITGDVELEIKALRYTDKPPPLTTDITIERKRLKNIRENKGRFTDQKSIINEAEKQFNSLLSTSDDTGSGSMKANCEELIDDDENCEHSPAFVFVDEKPEVIPATPAESDNVILPHKFDSKHPLNSIQTSSSEVTHIVGSLTVPSNATEPLRVNSSNLVGVTTRPVVTPSTKNDESGGKIDSRAASSSAHDPTLGGFFGRHKILIISGVSVSLGCVLLVGCCAVYRYRRRDEGSYKMDNRSYTLYETAEKQGAEKPRGGLHRLRGFKTKQKQRDNKEWYV